MGTNSFISNDQYDPGDEILGEHITQFKDALNGVLVGRQNDVPSAGQNLGSESIPFGSLHCQQVRIGNQVLDASSQTVPGHRITGGRTSTQSSNGRFVDITLNQARILGKEVPFSAVANGRTFTIDTDIAMSPTLGFAGAANTRETTLADVPATGDAKRFGEPDYAIGNQELNLAASVSQIANRVGEFAAFRIGTELVYAYILSSQKLRVVSRQYFIGPNNFIPPRADYATGTKVEILRTGWIFADADSPDTPEITYNSPIRSTRQPANPKTGDYWYDIRVDRWKRYDGTDWISVNRLPIAVVCSDSTRMVGFRCFDFFRRFAKLNEIEFERISDTEYMVSRGGRVSVFGIVQDVPRFAVFDIESDTEDGVTVQSMGRFHGYRNERGEFKASDKIPVWREDLGGYYHPYENWLAVLNLYNNSKDSTELVDDNNWFPFEKYSTKIKLLKKWVVSVNSAGTLQKRDSKSEKHPVLSSSRSGSGAGARYALVWRTGFFTEGPAVSGESSSGHGNLGYSSLASLTTSGWSGIIPYQAGSSGGPQDFVVELSAMGAQAEQIDIENSLL